LSGRDWSGDDIDVSAPRDRVEVLPFVVDAEVDSTAGLTLERCYVADEAHRGQEPDFALWLAAAAAGDGE
jgi:hypothetical protein